MLRLAEAALRLLALLALLWALWRALAPVRAPGLLVVDGAELPPMLARWSAAPAPDSVHAALRAPPGAVARDWLAALAAAGSVVTWSASDATPVAISVAADPDPAGGVRVAVAAPRGRAAAVEDEAGLLDTLPVAGVGAAMDVAAPAGAIAARVGDVRAARSAAAAHPARTERGVLLLARAGGEGKFVAAALEERGWRVDARFAVAPDARVEQGRAAPDDARHQVVVALDATAAPFASALRRHLLAGGGLVLGAEAAALPALAALSPARAGTIVRPPVARQAGAVEASSLPYRPLRLGEDGVALERRGDTVVVAARRAAAGRVVLVGVEETWRWRMAGADGAVALHRAWWSRVVSSAAPTPLGPAPIEAAEAAPVAAAIDRLGAPRPVPPLGESPAPAGLPAWTFGVAVTALLAEWTLRRLRGAR